MLVNLSKKGNTTNQHQTGFTLIEVLIVILILSFSIFSIYSLINLTLKMSWENKARIGATQLANEKIEIARNLAYDDVGTIGGVVAGEIPENETVERNGIEYNVYINVNYVDDDFDGTYESDPPDNLTNDYKRILVRVSWQSEFSVSPVEFFTDIAPKGVETTTGGGTLALTVYDVSGQPVEDAQIDIYNDKVDPVVDMTTYTNTSGNLILPGVKAATSSYEIFISKSGYSTDQTYDTTVDLPTPDKPHLTVFEGQTTSASFSIDYLADLYIYLRDINDTLLSNIAVDIRGEKRKGLDGDGLPVYKFDDTFYTNASGQVNLEDIEWDDYHIDVPTSTGFSIAQSDPPQPVELMPLDSQGVDIKVEPTEDHSLLTVVEDQNGDPIEAAEVLVTNSLGYNATSTTSSAGQSYFSPLSNTTTTVEVSKSGYETYSNEFIVNGYVTEPVILVPE